MTENEKTYHGKKDINYLFIEGAQNSPYLVVVFQAMPTAGNNFQKIYGYKKALGALNFHRLYIDDTCGPLGCFYMCENMDFSVEETTAMLIKEFMKEYAIKAENVITCGSSKGGTAALYFASKYGLGHAICGAPVTKIGSFICDADEETAKYMMGDSLSNENVEYLNRVVFRYINQQCTSDIRVLSSANDDMFNTHTLPLAVRAKECGVPVDITVDERIKSNRNIAQYFQPFIINNIFDIVLKDLKREKPVVSFEQNGVKVDNASYCRDGIRFRLRIVDDNESTVLYQENIDDDYYEFTTDELMSGVVYIDLRVADEDWVSYRVSDVIFDQGYFKYNGYDVKVNRRKKTLTIKLNVEQPHKSVRYIYNLSLNKEKIVPSFSAASNEYTFDIDSPGDYRVSFAIKVRDVGKILKHTNTIRVKFDQEA